MAAYLVKTVNAKKRVRQTSWGFSSGKWNFTESWSSSVRGPHTIASENRTSVKTPNFRYKRSTGAVLPDNPYTYEAFRNRQVSGYIRRFTPTGGGGYNQVELWYDPICAIAQWAPVKTLTQSAVYGKLINNARGQQWNVPIFFAEGYKTAEMVTQRATHLAHLVNALRRGNLVAFVNGLRNAADPSKAKIKRFHKYFGLDPRRAAGNTWLEYTYGWRPFMLDVKTAVEVLMDAADRPANMVGNVHASMKIPLRQSQTNVSIFQEDTGYNILGDQEKYGEESLRVNWRFRPNSLDLPARFGMINPLEVVWELVPFSFVADWFLPIGDYLSALDVPMRFSHVGGSVGTRISTKAYTIATRAQASTDTFSGFTGHSDYVKVTRTALTAMPSLELNKLSFQASLGANRVTSAVSLLSQQLSRLKR